MASTEGCCPPGSLPSYVDASYTPKGHLSSIGDADVYVTGTSRDTTEAVIVFPDVWGWNTGRIRAIADGFAECGYKTIIPKVLVPSLDGGTDGDGLPPNYNIGENFDEFKQWVTKIPFDSRILPKVKTIVEGLKADGVERIVVLGFCWGVWAACHTAVAFPAEVVATGGAHPSLKLEGLFGGDGSVFTGVKCPVLLLPASNDSAEEYDLPEGKYVKLFAGPTESVRFDSEVHGFVPRGDISNETTKAAVEKAMSLLIEFTNKSFAPKTKLF
eukprot:m.312897 g.312897  ORF g.312897 m.312897 type:complete len:271 (-) comp20247_c0_seq2:90-902(-)